MGDYLKDVNGKKSIKRVWADRLIKVGVGMNIVYFATWVYCTLKGCELPTYPTEMIGGMLLTGLGAIGLTPFEKSKNEDS